VEGGILVPFKEEEFAMAIIDLLKDPEKMKEMGRKGREWVVKNRSYEILARRLEEEYFEVLKTVKTRT
jgi:glycosyltransferase involved in cell wall biosynthesis